MARWGSAPGRAAAGAGGKCRLAPAVGLDSWGRLICRPLRQVPELQANSWCCKVKSALSVQSVQAWAKPQPAQGLWPWQGRQNDPSRYVELKLSFLTEAQRRASAPACGVRKRSQTAKAAFCGLCAEQGRRKLPTRQRKLFSQEGGRVLFAIPRRSVVQELAERLRQAFSGLPIQTLYGGAAPDERRRTAPLVVATTPQALRFYRDFDLVILDEVDAFPYRGSEALQRGTEQALRQGGKRIFMTATPDGSCSKRPKRRSGLWCGCLFPTTAIPCLCLRVVLGPFSADPLRIPKQVLALIKALSACLSSCPLLPCV